MIGWLYRSSISEWWNYFGYFAVTSRCASSTESVFSPRCALARSNVIYIYICTSFTCLHTGYFTTPLLSGQRVSLPRFVRINKQNQTRIQDGFHMSTWLVAAKNCAEGRHVNERRAHISQLQSKKQGRRKHHHPNPPGDHATTNTIPIYS